MSSKETTMIQVPGTLSIKHIHGSRGVFAVGDLVTDVGEFKIKDPLLDQFEEGKYQGQFLISNISPSSYFFGGKVVIEVRAWLADIFLDQADEGPAEPTPVEPDPVDEPVALGPVSGARGVVVGTQRTGTRTADRAGVCNRCREAGLRTPGDRIALRIRGARSDPAAARSGAGTVHPPAVAPEGSRLHVRPVDQDLAVSSHR
jgi:hypothetical protein